MLTERINPMKIIKTGNEAAWETNKMIISGWFSFFAISNAAIASMKPIKKIIPWH